MYDDTAVLGIALLDEPSYLARRREEVEKGATPMRRSTCYAMLRLLDLQPGAICLDAMCGSGSLPLEGTANFSQAVHVGSDVTLVDVRKARANAVQQARSADFGCFDACRLPMRTGSIDAVVIDLPFGRRHGSHNLNQSLYPRALRECGRAVRSGGKAVLLTTDKQILKQAIATTHGIWVLVKECAIVVGGGVLLRTTNVSVPNPSICP